MWDGQNAQVGIFDFNAGISYPILMFGGINGIMQDYDCFYDIVFIVDGSGTIVYRGPYDDVGLRAAIDGAVDQLASPVGETPRAEGQLLAAYPNPFNPRTSIPYEVGGSTGIEATVTLEILDLRGRIVQTLVQGRRAGGQRYEAVWDGTDTAGRRLPSGGYAVRLRVDGDVHSRVLTLLK